MCRDSKDCKLLQQPSKRKQKTKGYLKYQRYLKSKSYKQIREQVLKRDNYRCQCCNRCADEVPLTVHHSTYEHLFNEQEHLDGLICLCEVCHSAIHKANPHRFRRPDESLQNEE